MDNSLFSFHVSLDSIQGTYEKWFTFEKLQLNVSMLFVSSENEDPYKERREAILKKEVIPLVPLTPLLRSETKSFLVKKEEEKEDPKKQEMREIYSPQSYEQDDDLEERDYYGYGYDSVPIKRTERTSTPPDLSTKENLGDFNERFQKAVQILQVDQVCSHITTRNVPIRIIMKLI